MDIINFKKANCKNCYRCLRECPVKAIAFKDGQAGILNDSCILCGHCLTVCPQNAKQVRSDVEAIKKVIAGDKKVIASVAPSFVAAFAYDSLTSIEDALKKLGFYAARETSEGAAAVTKAYEKQLADRKTPVLISSSCPTVVRLVEKYYPESLPALAKVLSPMAAHAKMLKKAYGDAAVVFIGPCISKKDEAGWDKEAVDYVLTFDELKAWLDESGISPLKTEATRDGSKELRARFYPVSGGIIKSMGEKLPDVDYVSVSGINKCRKVLEHLREGELHGYFIEMSACDDSCIGGPCMTSLAGGLVESARKISDFAQTVLSEQHGEPEPSDFTSGIDLSRNFAVQTVPNQQPGERAISEILAKIGKKSKQDELNCGACGYASCREKAVAVYQGKAEINMCMPYMRERAEYISDNVIAFTPNAILVLDSFLNIQALNKAAVELFGSNSVGNIKGKYVGELTESSMYEEAIIRKQNILDRKVYLFRNDKYVEHSVIYVQEHNLVFGIYKDLTAEHRQSDNLKRVKIDTVETADRVIEKQMRIAQEIAMLLGESTAETKIALTKLKETMLQEGE